MKMLPGKMNSRALFCLSSLLLLAVSAQAGTTGLQGEYFSEKRLTGTQVNRVDATVDFDFSTAALPAGIDNQDLSVRWMGDLIAPTTGTYQFFTASDDGSRLFVNGVLVVKDNWVDQGETERGGGTTLTLTAGQRYPILMEFYQGNGGVSARLRWTPPGGTKQIIPTANLVPRPTTNIGGGALTAATPVAMPASVNLTTTGSMDWIHFGQGGVTGRNRKNGSTVRISDYGQQGPASEAVAVSTSTTPFTWTDGATAGDVVNAVATTGGTTGAIQQGDVVGNGFEILVPADAVGLRRVLVYVGAAASAVNVRARLSDFSADEVTVQVPANSQRICSFDFRASRANQNLIVTATVPGAGPARLIGAALQAFPQTSNQTFNITEDSPQAFTIAATDPEGQALNFVQLTPLTNGSLNAGPFPNYTYTPNANISGTDSFSFTITDPQGLQATGIITFNIASTDDGPPILQNDTATTNDNVPVTVNVLQNDTIIDTPFAISILTQPTNGTAVLNPDNTITYTGNLTFIGTDLITYRVTDFDGNVATATLTVTIAAIPPTITSPLAVDAIQNLQFTYQITSLGTLPLAYTASPLPPGTTLVGDTITGFIQPGSYLVTLTATNQAGVDIKQLVISAIPQTPNVDTDGDGYPDEFEIGVGSSPVDPTSTPFTVLRDGTGALPPGTPPPGTPKPFFLAGLGIKLNFKSRTLTRDAISVKGTLPVAATFSSQIQAVAINVGGVTLKGVLDSRGNYTSTDKTVKIKFGKTKATLGSANVPFSASAKGVYAPTLSDEGYADTNATKVVGNVKVLVVVGYEYFGVTANTEYTARLGKSGSVKPTKLK
jgi:hypothetical protein